MPGSSIDDAIRDGLILAATEWVSVRLYHNSNEYWIRPNDLLKTVLSKEPQVAAT
jgi:hypothetical protein